MANCSSLKEEYIYIKGGKLQKRDFNGNCTYIEVTKHLKERIKEKIRELLQKDISPIKARDLLYLAICDITKCQVKQACKVVLEQEAVDPLYIELENFILSLAEYKELLKSSRQLKITPSQFLISDLNGVIDSISNDDVDIEQITKVVDSQKWSQTSVKVLLKELLCVHFEVVKASLSESNPVVLMLIDKISTIQSQNITLERRVTFKDGGIWIKVEKNYYPPADNVTVDALKAQIISCIRDMSTSVSKRDIIFVSLEQLTGLKAKRTIQRYVTKRIGEIKKDVLVEDPLYTELCVFIDTIPEYQEYKKATMEASNMRNEANRIGRELGREAQFVDYEFSFRGTYLQRKFPYCRKNQRRQR